MSKPKDVKRRIVWVDDEPERITAHVEALEDEGYEVYRALNAIQGIWLIRELIPDVVISDYRMPDMSGLEVCELMRANPDLKNTPFILHTAHDLATLQKLVSKSFDYDPIMHFRRLLPTQLLDILDEVFILLEANEKVLLKKKFSLDFISETFQSEDTIIASSVINSIDQLVSKLKDTNLNTRANAVVNIAEMRVSDKKILRETPAQDVFFRNVRHSVLGSTDDHSLVNDWGHFSGIALALTKPRDEQNISLRKLIADHQPARIQENAINALGLNGDVESFEIILNAVNSKHKSVRIAAVRSLGLLHDDRALVVLKDKIYDPSVTIRFTAINALATIGTPEAVSILEHLMQDDVVATRIDLIKAIMRAESRVPKDIVLNVLTNIVDVEKSDEVLYIICNALFQLGIVGSKDLLKKLSNHPSEYVSDEARRLLGKS